MKAMVLYYSKTGHTQKMAEIIAQGMERVQASRPKPALSTIWTKRGLPKANASSWARLFISPASAPTSSPGSKGHARNASSPASWAEPSRRWIISTAAATWASASSRPHDGPRHDDLFRRRLLRRAGHSPGACSPEQGSGWQPGNLPDLRRTHGRQGRRIIRSLISCVARKKIHGVQNNISVKKLLEDAILAFPSSFFHLLQ